VSDPAKYFGWVKILNTFIEKSLMNSCKTQPNILAEFKLLNQVIKKAKYIAVRPSQIFWLSLYSKSWYN
jgi:hypothetical protein